MANIWEKAMSILAENLNFGSSYLITTVLHIRTIYTTHIRVVRVWEGTGRHVLFHFSTVADAWSIIARLHLMPKSDIASQTMIDFQFSKKKNPSRTHQAGGRRRTGSRPFSQPVNERAGGLAAAATWCAPICGGGGTVAYGFFRSMWWNDVLAVAIIETYYLAHCTVHRVLELDAPFFQAYLHK